MVASIRRNGTEFQVNTYTRRDQEDPNIATDPSTGGFQIVWESDGQDGDGLGVYGQSFDSSGTPVGTEFRINTVTVGDQQNPDVAFNADGNGSWVWQTNAIWNTGTETGNDAVPINFEVAENWRTRSKTFGFEEETFEGVGYEAYNEERVRYGRTFDEADNNAFDPRVIALGDEHFAVAMQRTQRGSDVVVDEYVPSSARAANNREGAWSRNFTEDELTPRGQTTSNDIAQLNAETLIVANTMTTNYETGAMGIIQFQPFIRDLRDSRQGVAFELGDRYELDESGLTGPAAFPAIAVLSDGGFAITWSEYNYLDDPDNPHFDAYVQVFNRNFTERTRATKIHNDDDGQQVDSKITALNDGGFVISYNDFFDADGDHGAVMLQRFDDSAVRLGKAFVANSTTNGRQADSNLTTLNNGDVVVTWESANLDGNGKGVAAQIFDMVGYGNRKAQDLFGTPGNETFRTGAGKDNVDGGGGKDKIFAGGGADRANGGDGADVVNGGGGNDNIRGGEGNDRMIGKGGNDRIAGEEGNDVLIGNAGKDKFVFEVGRDTIKDFQDNTDTVLFDHSLVTGQLTIKRLKNIAVERADEIFFNFGDGNRLTIEGISEFSDLRNDIGFV